MQRAVLGCHPRHLELCCTQSKAELTHSKCFWTALLMGCRGAAGVGELSFCMCAAQVTHALWWPIALCRWSCSAHTLPPPSPPPNTAFSHVSSASDKVQSPALCAGLRLQCKYKGHSNRNTQIRGSFSADGNNIICGSDDGYVYMWSLKDEPSSSSSQAAAKKVCVHHHCLYR